VEAPIATPPISIAPSQGKPRPCQETCEGRSRVHGSLVDLKACAWTVSLGRCTHFGEEGYDRPRTGPARPKAGFPEGPAPRRSAHARLGVPIEAIPTFTGIQDSQGGMACSRKLSLLFRQKFPFGQTPATPLRGLPSLRPARYMLSRQQGCEALLAPKWKGTPRPSLVSDGAKDIPFW
jgi:hypothetical protein